MDSFALTHFASVLESSHCFPPKPTPHQQRGCTNLSQAVGRSQSSTDICNAKASSVRFMGTKNVQRTLGLYKVSALWVQVSARPPLRLQFLTGTPPSIINGKTAVLAFSEVQMGRPKQHYWRLMFARFSQSSTDCGLYCCHSLKFDLSGSLAAQTCFKELCFKNSGAEGLPYSFGSRTAFNAFRSLQHGTGGQGRQLQPWHPGTTKVATKKIASKLWQSLPSIRHAGRIRR